MKKYFIYIFIVGIILILLGVGIFIGTKQNEKNMKDQQNADLIVESFSKFKELATDFSNERVKLYGEVFDEVIISSLSEKKGTNDALFDAYLEKLEALDESAAELKELCPNHTYKDQDIVSKCSSFVTAYENSINYFVKDVRLYNSNLEKYNSTSSNKIELYKSDKYKDFIDYNEDGVYIGRD